jgi:hypothetical protein
LTILLGIESRIQADYLVVEDAKTLWAMLGSASQSMLKLNIFKITEGLRNIKLKDCGDSDNYTSRINRTVKDFNICAVTTALLTTDTDAADTDSAKAIAKRSEQDHIIFLHHGIQRYYE